MSPTHRPAESSEAPRRRRRPPHPRRGARAPEHAVAPQLLVLGDEEALRRWSVAVSEATALVGVAPSLIERSTLTSARDPVQDTLTLARAARGPLLVLPAGDPPAATSPRRDRVLVPVDGTAEEAAVLGPLVERANRHGLGVQQLHVLCETTVPVMWDGPGHHATAWLSELRRRHQVGEAVLQVSSGDPASAITAAAAQADLLVLAWNGDDAAEHAAVLRALLDQGGHAVMLVPVPRS
ncbi:MAG: universal stress protein [Actinomycetota bacterium]|nr:universal stress protein [Actinomycetota bacterium]MDA8073756.1 universal stress protein [Actinomycetota bacterium]